VLRAEQPEKSDLPHFKLTVQACSGLDTRDTRDGGKGTRDWGKGF
jgi:hypothetical protein